MSRIRISHQPDGWRDDGPATPQKQHGWAGAMVVGASGHQSIRTDRQRPSRARKDTPRKSRAYAAHCDYQNAITCARAAGHKGAHESREALDRRNITRRAWKASQNEQTTSR